MEKNRLEIKPLIENYMDNLADGEFAISQITGHITIRNEKEYISKTKELQTSIMDAKSFKEDITSKINNDKSLTNTVATKIANISTKITECQNLMTEIRNRLNTYESKINTLEADIKKIDSYLRSNMILNIQTHYRSGINGNLVNLCKLMVKTEFLDIIDNTYTNYFKKTLGTAFNYYGTNGVVKNYGTITQNNTNKTNVDALPTLEDYNNFKTSLEAKYQTLFASYPDLQVSGNYTITNATAYHS